MGPSEAERAARELGWLPEVGERVWIRAAHRYKPGMVWVGATVKKLHAPDVVAVSWVDPPDGYEWQTTISLGVGVYPCFAEQ